MTTSKSGTASSPYRVRQEQLLCSPATMNLPSIAVVTPSFNQARYLDRAIHSVLDQGYPKLEYLVLDGGSTDGSPDIIRRYADRLTYWRSGPDSGQAAAVNEGWGRATGEGLGWI